MASPDESFQFGPFKFSSSRGLWRDTVMVPLPHQQRQLLKCLLERPGEIVRKEELIAAVWSTTHTSDNALNVLTRRLRVTLGDTQRPYQWIRSVPRIGLMISTTPLVSRRTSPEGKRFRGDKSRFVRDVTIPDGSIFKPGERFEKVWEIQNVGTVPWKDRYLRRLGACSGPGRLISDPRVAIPDSDPGEPCLVRASLVAPDQPGTYYAAWKMIDVQGRVCLPRQAPLFVNIDVLIRFE